MFSKRYRSIGQVPQNYSRDPYRHGGFHFALRHVVLYTRSRKKVPAPEVGGQREPPDASPNSEVRRAAAAAIWGQVGSPGEWVSWRRPALH